MLWRMDSFRLVRVSAIATAVVWGAAVAAISWSLTGTMDADQTHFMSREVAPLAEESLKAGFIIVLLATGRVGFLVDATVLGFAVGTGFAVIENLAYLRVLPAAPTVLWVVRGFGTGVLHGATTAIFAIVAKSVLDRGTRPRMLATLPALAAAVVIHSFYNHQLLPAVAEMYLLLIVSPVLVIWIFQRSEARVDRRRPGS